MKNVVRQAIVDPIPSRTPGDNVESLYRFLVESLSEYAVFAISATGTIMTWNSGAGRIFGYSEAEIIGRPLSTIFSPEDIAVGAPEQELKNAVTERTAVQDRWHVRKDGSRFWGTNTVEPMFDAAGTMIGYTKLVRDTTQTYLAVQALADSEERLRLLVESVPTYAICSTDVNGTITIWNSGAQSTFGYEPRDIVGQSIARFLNVGDAPQDDVIRTLQRAACETISTERWLSRKDGTRFLCSMRLTQLKRGNDDRPRGFVLIAHDITQRYLATEEMRHRALYDALTRLPNRASFFEHVGRAIALMARHPESLFAVLFIDLDHFKHVNDTLGHIAADKVLESIARQLEGCVRSEDIVARLSGDEFAVLLNGIGGLADARDAASRIQSVMSKAQSIDGRPVFVSASIGIALGSPQYQKPDEVLRDADTAMYAAKRTGRARSVVYEQPLTAANDAIVRFEADLRGAIDRQELRVDYQPIVRLSDCGLVGFEALVRWEHPRLGLLAPASFIPRAEQTELIVAIDRWVLVEACHTFGRLQGTGVGGGPLTMSVNISSKSFAQPDFLAYLQQTLARTGVDPHLLVIELTESAFMERSERSSVLVESLHALGIALHADDFGVGYWSLAALQHLPVQALKIDRSFVCGLDAPREPGLDALHGAELVRTIVTLAHNLDLVAIAEGVETVAQLERLTEFGCDYGQGILFARPLDAHAARTFIDSSRTAEGTAAPG